MLDLDPILRAATAALVVGVAALAFTVSFEAIRAFAITSGAFPPRLGWCAPLLVDTFIAAATLVILSRSRTGLGAAYAWTLLGVATGCSVALNVAHAPHRLAARLVAALPPLAQLAAVELGMSEARRALPSPSTRTHRRANRASAQSSVLVGSVPPDAPPRNAPAVAAVTRGAAAPERGARALVRALVERERQTGVRLTGVQVGSQVGLKPRRAQELLRDLRAELDALPGVERTARAPVTPADRQATSLTNGERLALPPPQETPQVAEGGALTCITTMTASLLTSPRPQPRHRPGPTTTTGPVFNSPAARFLLHPRQFLTSLAHRLAALAMATAHRALVPTLTLVAVAALGALTLGAVRGWHARRARRTARYVEVLAPPEADLAGATQLWSALHDALRPRWQTRLIGRHHLAFELTWRDLGALRIGVWVPGTVPPGVVERAIEGAWPGTATRTIFAPPAPLPLPLPPLTTIGRSTTATVC